MKALKKGKALLAGLTAALLLGAFLILGHFSREESHTVTTFSMGSYVQQTLYGGGGEGSAAKAAAAVTELENLISWRVEGSDISRLNAGASEGVRLDPRTWGILQTCRAVSRNSQGAFDPTIAPVSRLWDFDGTPRVPDEAQLADALSQVDYHALSLPMEYEAALALDHSLDLGAVGKGAACDAVLESWRESGAHRGVVSVGGSVGLFGKKPWGRPWTVAVRDPAGSNPAGSSEIGALGTLSLSGGCVSTSGSYEKTFTENGRTYHHLLDPKTGWPADSGLVSVTVWRGEGDGQDGAFSDALSTACFVLGMEKSLPLLELFNAEAVFVIEDGKVSVTKNLESAFTLTSPDYTLEALHEPE